MSSRLIALVTMAYIGTAISFWFEGKRGMSLAFAGYALANIGLIMEAQA